MERKPESVSPVLRGAWRVAVVVLAAVWTLAWIWIGQVAASDWARLRYDLRGPSTARECGEIRTGMTLVQVQGVIDHKAGPFMEVLEGPELRFWRRRNACLVRFDPKTELVVRAYSEKAVEVFAPEGQ